MITALIRTIILYFLIMAGLRLMGKRQIGELEPSELVLALLISDLAAVPMQDFGIPLINGVFPILTLLSLAMILSVLNLKSIPMRNLICGSPTMIIRDGHVLQDEMRRTRLTVDELIEDLRQQGVVELDTIQYAILETNGQISTFPYGRCRPPVAKESGIQADDPLLPYTLISDGRILSHNLAAAGRDRRWLEETLRRLGCRAEDLFLLTADDAGTLYAARKEQTP